LDRWRYPPKLPGTGRAGCSARYMEHGAGGTDTPVF